MDRKRRTALGAAMAWMAAAGALAAPAAGRRRTSVPVAQGLSPQAAALVHRVRASGDADGQPWAVVDKRAARLHVFEPSGRLRATTPVLVGATPGDDSVPGVGERAQAGLVGPDERTTPAGRYATEPGRNAQGEAIVWLDWEAALAIHRLRPGRSQGLRQASLDGSDPAARRLSAGCVVVPVRFYLDVIEPLLGRRPGVVYVLPDTRPLQDVFSRL